MALQFPLLFIFGEHGWSPELKFTNDNHRGDKNLTMNMFYSYQLHDRLNMKALLLQGGGYFNNI